ncbi:MAG TPA: hypothetical protein VM537_35540 [Anaerolineae bacterium]|nr:hypothetical protein [Anaerolineae bacterium]
MGVVIVMAGMAGYVAMFHFLDKAKRRVVVLEDALKRIQGAGTWGLFAMDEHVRDFKTYALHAAQLALDEHPKYPQ